MVTKIIYIFSFIFSIGEISFAQYLPDLKINEDSNSAIHGNASISFNDGGDAMIVWYDERNYSSNYGDIYAQKFNNYLIRTGENFKINNVNDSLSKVPKIVMTNNGKSIFAFTGLYNSLPYYYLIRIFINNIPITSIIRSNDTVSYLIIPYKHNVDVNKNNGNLFHVFNYSLSPWIVNNVYLQIFDQDGNRIGNNIKINDNTLNNAIQEDPVITVKKNGSYIIVWSDKRESISGAADIYMQMFDTQGNRIGVNRKVNDDNNGWFHQDEPSIASDSRGNFVIAWEDYRINDVYRNVFAQYFDSNGNPVGQNIRVDHGFTAWDRYMPKVAMSDSGNIVIAWTDDDASDPTTVYFRRYNPSWIPLGNQRKISNQAPQTLKVLNDCKLKGDRIMTAWTDYRNNGYDIYYNVISFQNPDSIISNTINTSSIIPDKFYLHQNYPNPFNPTTHLQFGISKLGFVSLKVYDVLGTEVAILVNKTKPIGSYKVEFDGHNLASGIYFYSLEVDGNIIDTKRMLLLK